jgi:hypothetical protein
VLAVSVEVIYSIVAAVIILPTTAVIYAWFFDWNWTKALKFLAAALAGSYVFAIAMQTWGS